MIKKLLFSVLFIAAAMLPLCACTQINVDERPDDPEDSKAELEYELTADKSGYVVSQADYGDTAEVPASYNGMPVVGIDNFAFSYSNVRSVTIADGVQYIGQYAFQNCYELEEVTLPESIASIGNYAFFECFELAKINLPEGIDNVSDLYKIADKLAQNNYNEILIDKIFYANARNFISLWLN